MDAIYVVRRSPEWMLWQIDAGDTWKIRDLWDRSFNISYMGFRRFLNDLREQNLRNTKFSRVFNDFEKTYKKAAWMPGSVIFPTDDDDWFHDDILDIIGPMLDPEALAHRWRYSLYEKGRCVSHGEEDLLRMPPPLWLYHTNNFCIRTPWAMTCVGHGEVNQYFFKHPKERYLDEILSVHNRNLASRSLWWYEIPDQESLFRLYEEFREPPTGVVLPTVFDKYIEPMLDFYRRRLKIQTKKKWF